MLLKITHQTDLSYSDLISESVMELRMVPRQAEDQHRLSFTLGLGPPASASSYFDWLGNTVHAFTINAFHRQIRIVATSVVETQRDRIEPPALPDVWPIAPGGMDYPLFDYLCFRGPIADSPQLRQFVQQIAPVEGERLGAVAMRIVDQISQHFTYKAGVTTATSPITEMLDHGYGVCQDFTHLMIGAARALRIPARYVSGFLHPEAQRYKGYTQSHAWCELFFPSTGWIGFDPANQCVVADNFVAVAIGRDYYDVPPNKGIYRGTASETIDVSVHTEELHTIPAGLAAERMQTLNIPTYASVAAHREYMTQQQEHQQQQWVKPECPNPKSE